MARKQTKTDVRPLNSCNQTKVWTGRHNERLACVQVEQTSSEEVGEGGGWRRGREPLTVHQSQSSSCQWAAGLGALTPAGPRALALRRWGNIPRRLSAHMAAALAGSQVAVLLTPASLYFLLPWLPHICSLP